MDLPAMRVFVVACILITWAVGSIGVSARAPESSYGIHQGQRQAFELELLSLPPTVSPKALADDMEIISFDGDLDKIQQLALEKANQEQSPSTSPSLPDTDVSDAPTSDPTIVITPDSEGKPTVNNYTCPGETTEHLEILTYKFAIETVADAELETVYGEVQEHTLEHVAPVSLACGADPTVFYANIIAMDATLPSKLVEQETCAPTLNENNTCAVVMGHMRLFLSDKESIDDAVALVITNIQTTFARDTFTKSVGSGLVRITFLFQASSSTQSPVLDSIGQGANNNRNGSGSTSQATGEDYTMGRLTSVFVGIGGASLVLFVASLLLWRRRSQNKSEEDEEGQVTNFAGSSVHDTFDYSNRSKQKRSSSPFSETVASAYRLGDSISILSQTGMSPVYEDEDGSIVVSESGYSTEAQSFHEETELSATPGMLGLYQSEQQTPECLGALPRTGGTAKDIDLDAASCECSDSDTSTELSTPVRVTKLLLVPQGSAEEEDPVEEEEALLFQDHEKALTNLVLETTSKKNVAMVSMDSPDSIPQLAPSPAESDVHTIQPATPPVMDEAEMMVDIELNGSTNAFVGAA